MIRFTNRIDVFLNTIRPDEDFRQFGEPGGPDASSAGVFLASFLKKSLVEWNEYKSMYLIPRVEQFYYFARYMGKVKGEKYVLNFYQFEFFPQIRVTSRAMDIIRSIVNALSNTNDGANLYQKITVK